MVHFRHGTHQTFPIEQFFRMHLPSPTSDPVLLSRERGEACDGSNREEDVGDTCKGLKLWKTRSSILRKCLLRI